MKIWTLTYNDDNGSPDCDVFNTQKKAETAASEWVEAYQDNFPHVDFNRPWKDVFEALTEEPGFIDSISLQEHVVFPPEPSDPVEKAYVEAARRIHGKDGVCEIDDGTIVSISEDGGAYVQAWVWVNEGEIS